MGRGEMGGGSYSNNPADVVPSYHPRAAANSIGSAVSFVMAAMSSRGAERGSGGGELPPAYRASAGGAGGSDDEGAETFADMARRDPPAYSTVALPGSAGPSDIATTYHAAFQAISAKNLMRYLEGGVGLAYNDTGVMRATLEYIPDAKAAVRRYLLAHKEQTLAGSSASPPERTAVQRWFSETCGEYVAQQETQREKDAALAAFVHVGRCIRSFGYFMQTTHDVTRGEMNSPAAFEQITEGLNAHLLEAGYPVYGEFYYLLIMVHIGAVANLLYNEKMLQDGRRMRLADQVAKFEAVLRADPWDELDAVEVVILKRFDVPIVRSTLTPDQERQQRTRELERAMRDARGVQSANAARDVTRGMMGLVVDRDAARSSSAGQPSLTRRRESPPRGVGSVPPHRPSPPRPSPYGV